MRSQFFTQPPSFSPAVFYVRLKSGDPTESIALLERTWKSLVPDVPFSYSFLDEKFDAFYTSEQRWSRIVGWAGGISVFLACLGLFGLASLAVANRTKEIGIRKVLGASVASVTALLSKDFVKLVLIALVLAAPVAWFVLEEWLKTFAYRITLQVWVVCAYRCGGACRRSVYRGTSIHQGRVYESGGFVEGGVSYEPAACWSCRS